MGCSEVAIKGRVDRAASSLIASFCIRSAATPVEFVT